MRSTIAMLRSLVLPYGATSGQRIIIDGVNATISAYDAADFLFATLTVTGGIPGFYVFGNDGSQVGMARVNATGKAELEQFGAGAATRFRIRDARIETDTIQAAVGPVGAIVGKLQLFTLAGASAGFLPVYNAIP